MALKDVKKVSNISWPVVGSVAVGIALFGASVWAIRKAPSNAVTDPLKRGANIASGS